MAWDEENRLMALSDNGKTSRYTYNAAGDRVVKSHGYLEGVYVNGAPQGLTFHETEDYTIYPAPILSVTRQRFTKHYFIGDRRIASKIGAGIFQNAYGHGANVVTAGQKDYQMRMMQIERQREDYYRKLGTPPGVPTMKGATAEPENTHEGYNTIIKELGDHSVPDGWIQRPKRNTVPGTPPGPPVQWDKAEDPDDVQPGYGYVPADTTHEDIFYYHTDHLGSTSYITDAKANVAQFDAYLPYGELLVDEHSSTEEMPYKFNGKELDQETGLYYYGARYMNPKTSLWYGVDPLAEKYPSVGAYVYCMDRPTKLIDTDGRKVIISGSRKQRIIVLNQLQKLTNYKLGVKQNGEVVILATHGRNKSKKLTVGNSLIESVIKHKRTMTIQTTDPGEKSSEHDIYRRDAFNGKGTDVVVNFDVTDTPKLLTENGKTGKSSEEVMPLFLVLGHEIIHGERSMDGIAIDPDTKSSYKYRSPNGQLKIKNTSKEELETVGIIGKAKRTENALRKEHGLNKRIKY